MHFLENNFRRFSLAIGRQYRARGNQVFDYVLLLYVTRIVGRRQLGADPDPTRSRPDPDPTRSPASIKKGRPEGRPKFMEGLGAIP